MTSFVQWLDSRKVAVRVLMLRGVNGGDDLNPVGTTITLPNVERIFWAQNEVGGSLIEEVLLCCPNLTSIEGGRFDPPAYFIEQHAPKLKEVTIYGVHTISPQKVICCHQFKVLRMKEHPANNLIIPESTPTSWPLLETLEITVDMSWFICIFAIIKLCPSLRELVLYGNGINPQELWKLATCMQIKRLTLRRHNIGTESQFQNLFLSFLERRPDMEHLQFNRLEYSPATGLLDITVVNAHAEMMTRVLTCCPLVSKFYIKAELSSDLVEVLAEHLGGRLETLSVWCQPADTTPMSILLARCGPSLTHLRLYDKGVEDTVLRMIGQNCPLLENLHLTPKFASVLSDDGMIAVVKGCPRLLHFSVTVASRLTIKTLQAMIDSRLHLKTLKLNFLKDVDVAWLLQQYKNHGVLPVPHVDFSKLV